MQPPVTAGDPATDIATDPAIDPATDIAIDVATGTGAAAPVVAVLDPRPLVRSALVDALVADGALVVLASADTGAGALEALGAVDVVVAADPSWARGLRRVDPEPLDVGDQVGLAAVVRSAAAGPVPAPPVGAAADGAGAAELTPREAAVLDCFARGLTAAQAAVDLGVSPSAVASAKRRVLTKLGVATPVEALRLTGRGRSGPDGPAAAAR